MVARLKPEPLDAERRNLNMARLIPSDLAYLNAGSAMIVDAAALRCL